MFAFILGSTPKASGFEILGVEKCRYEDATFCTCSVVFNVFTLHVLLCLTYLHY
jgi:hypothetical protein